VNSGKRFKTAINRKKNITLSFFPLNSKLNGNRASFIMIPKKALLAAAAAVDQQQQQQQLYSSSCSCILYGFSLVTI